MNAREMRTEMMRLVSATVVRASGIGLGVGALFVALAALLQ